ncbi:ExbD/TolR family protein [Sphingomonas sp.]|uniref:ExbD/TolR family protein n=1 Tax=Sphingomonas sp. TaxID=28214 RepID=UPI003CC5479B
MARTVTRPAALSFEPVAQLNITPLIDVLLVLIVMLILTLPVATHEVPVALPGAPRGTPDPRAADRLTIEPSGAVWWNGAAVDADGLAARLRGSAATGKPLMLAPAATAPYGQVDRTLATVKRAGVTRLGFEGNERFAAF